MIPACWLQLVIDARLPDKFRSPGLRCPIQNDVTVQPVFQAIVANRDQGPVTGLLLHSHMVPCTRNQSSSPKTATLPQKHRLGAATCNILLFSWISTGLSALLYFSASFPRTRSLATVPETVNNALELLEVDLVIAGQCLIRANQLVA